MATTTTNPKILSLHGKGLKLDTRADIEPHLAGWDPKIVEEVHFGGNTIGVEASLALAEFLERTEVLKVADFADIFTGRLISEIPLALSAICDALASKTTLIEINLSDNAFGGRSVDPMVPFLTTNRSFQILRLNNNGLGPAGGEVIASALLESAKRSKAEGKASQLRVVICGRNRLENGSAERWAEAFEAHGGLVEVRMVQNGIRMEGVRALARGLSFNPNLEIVDLQDNTFTSVDAEEEEDKTGGVDAWTDVLGRWPALKTLNLSDCVLSVDGEVPALLTKLASGSNPKLETLQLQNNNLDSGSFEVLAGAVKAGAGLGGLKRLEVQWNEVEEDDEHVESMKRSLKARGGRVIATDEDEEEEDDGEKEEEEDAKEENEDEVKVKIEPNDSAEDLAALLGKVEIRER